MIKTANILLLTSSEHPSSLICTVLQGEMVKMQHNCSTESCVQGLKNTSQHFRERGLPKNGIATTFKIAKERSHERLNRGLTTWESSDSEMTITIIMKYSIDSLVEKDTSSEGIGQT